MRTLVLPPRYTPDSNALWKAAVEIGWEVERLSSWRVPAGFQPGNVVLYGEPLFAAVVADSLNVALLEPSPTWLPSLPMEVRLRDVRHQTAGDARRIVAPAFIKPAIDKCFVAAVYQAGSELPSSEVLPDDVPVLVAEPVTWEVEYRLFVLEGQIATMSPYWRNGKLAQDEFGRWPSSQDEENACWELAARVLADSAAPLPPAVVLDLGRIADRGWAVVEANAAWGSGIYGCDPSAVLSVVGRACVPRDGLAEADRPWVAAVVVQS